MDIRMFYIKKNDIGWFIRIEVIWVKFYESLR